MLADREFYNSLRFFSADEFDYPEKMSQALLKSLDWARHYAGVPFRITDDWRAHSSGAHVDGDGVDIAVTSSHERYCILRGLVLAGFVRWGDYDKHIHADVSTRLAQEVAWIGKSK